MYNKIMGFLMITLVVLSISFWFTIPQCPYCHEKMLEKGYSVGEYRLHTKCVANLVDSYPMGCPIHGMSYGKPTLGTYCEKCGKELKTCVTNGEIDCWIIKQLRKEK